MAKRKAGSAKSKAAALKKAWDNSEVRSSGDLPDGEYLFIFEGPNDNGNGTSIGPNDDGEETAVMVCKIAAGECKGRTKIKYSNLEDPDRISWFRGDMAKLGYDVASIDDAVEAFEELIGTYFLGVLKTKGEWQNLYINQALDADEAEQYLDDDDDDNDDAEAEDDTDDDTDSDDEDGDFEIGMRVIVDFDGEDFAGEVNGVDGDKISVAFDDGTEEEVSADDCRLEDSDSDDDDDDEEEEDADGEDEDVEGIIANFDDDDLNASNIKKIKALAKKHDVDEDGYESLTDMLCDIAETLEVEGEFDKATKLISACG